MALNSWPPSQAPPPIPSVSPIGWRDIAVIRTRRDASLNDSNLQVRTSLGEGIRSAKTARARTNDDDVGLGVGVKVVEVSTSHSTSDLRLPDAVESELLPLPFGDLGASVGVDLAIADRDTTLVREGSGLNNF